MHKYNIKLVIKHNPVKSHCILVVILMCQLNHVMKIKIKAPHSLDNCSCQGTGGQWLLEKGQWVINYWCPCKPPECYHCFIQLEPLRQPMINLINYALWHT